MGDAGGLFPKDMSKPSALVPVNMTLFGKRVVAGVIEARIPWPGHSGLGGP